MIFWPYNMSMRTKSKMLSSSTRAVKAVTTTLVTVKVRLIHSNISFSSTMKNAGGKFSHSLLLSKWASSWVISVELKCYCMGFTGLSSPCMFVLAVDGSDGETKWERPLNFDLQWAQCGFDGMGGKGAGCLLAHTNTLTAISIDKGMQVQKCPHTHTHR